MRSAGLLQLAACLSSLAPIASAWPGWLPEADALVVRQADDTSAPAGTGDATGTATNAPSPTAGKALTTANLNTAKVRTGTQTEADSAEQTGTGTGTGDATDTGKGTGTGKSGATKTSGDGEEATGRETFAPNDPPGGVSMIAPATTAQATPLFKIGDDVTLSWNYTSLQGTPTAIDVYVSCTTTGFRETWTLTANMSFQTDVSFVWRTEEQANDVEAPLPVALYTLVIKDSDVAMNAVPDPGYLGAFNQFTFGLYTPKPYTPLAGWTCAGCNAAMAKAERQAVSFIMAMGFVTVASFTWFVTGLGLQ